MREQGKTYKEISEKTGLSKSSISWVISRYFPSGNQELIYARNLRNSRTNPKREEHLERMRSAARNYYSDREQSAVRNWLLLIESHPDKELILFIAGLYAGEGNHQGTEFYLCNSDPYLINLFLCFLRSVLCLEEERISIRLSIPLSIDRNRCVDFWVGALGRGIDFVDQYDGRPQKKEHLHNKHREYYGVLKVRVKKPLGIAKALRQVYPVR